jgi:hypothetical protein
LRPPGSTARRIGSNIVGGFVRSVLTDNGQRTRDSGQGTADKKDYPII